MTSATQGGAAVGSGNTLEQTVIATLTSKGFAVVPHKFWRDSPDQYGQELLLTRVPYVSIYGHISHTEFLLHSARFGLDIRIECKWQQSKGSVDEKLPYLYLNCVTRMPERKIFIIIDGGGFKSGAITWLREACRADSLFAQSTVDKDICVMSLTEFLIWANSTLRG